MASPRDRSLPALPILLGAALGLLAFAALPLSANESGRRDVPASAGPVQFGAHVQPIFEQLCTECHGPGEAGGGLDLTSRAAVERGSNSGGRLLGGPLDSNVIWDRVAAADPDYRMPKGGRLTDEQLAVLRAWIEQGSPWEEPEAEDATTSGWPSPIDAVTLTVRQHPVVLVALLVALLVVVRLKRVGSREGSPPFVAAVARHLRARDVGFVFIAIVAFDLLSVARTQVARAEVMRADLVRQKESNPVFAYLYGNPPQPYRHPVRKTLEATYWRGNCERSHELYNGGRYLTCTMHLSLCDKARNPLGIGDPVPSDGLFMRFDIRRAPNTAGGMYAESRMSRVFLDDDWYPHRINRTIGEPVTLEVIEKDWVWAAFVPLGVPANGRLEALWYAYEHLRTDGLSFKPMVHLGIRCELEIENGRLAEGSDLWLGNLFWNRSFQPPPRAYRLPLEEWLHHEPIPEIPEGQSYHQARTDR